MQRTPDVQPPSRSDLPKEQDKGWLYHLWSASLVRAIRQVVETAILLTIILEIDQALLGLIERHLSHDADIGTAQTLLLAVRVGSDLVVAVLFMLHAAETTIRYFQFLRGRQHGGEYEADART